MGEGLRGGEGGEGEGVVEGRLVRIWEGGGGSGGVLWGEGGEEVGGESRL